MHESFADWYGLVSLHFDGAMLNARWSAVEQIAGQLAVAEIPDLIRLFYGCPQPNPVREQLKTVAKAADAGFLMERGDAELSIMAGGVIAYILREQLNRLADPAALAVTCMEVQGLRPMRRLQGVVDETATYLAQQSVRVRTKLERPVQDQLPATVQLSECVDGCNLESKRRWVLRGSVQAFPELCPMLFALSKSVEVGGSGDWIAAFENGTAMKASQEAPPLDIALQVYNEALLIRALRQ